MTFPPIPVELKRHPAAPMPAKATEGAAGYDLHALVSLLEGKVVVPARGRAKIRTGISVNINNPWIALQLMARSGLAGKGISLANGVGLVDSDYQGEIGVLLENSTDEDFIVHHGDRIAQMVFVPVVPVTFQAVPTFTSTTARGEGGFGSTGG